MADELDDGLDYSFDQDLPESQAIAADELDVSDGEGPDRDVSSGRPKKKQKNSNNNNKAAASLKRQLRMQQDMEFKKTIGTRGPAAIADFVYSRVKNVKAHENLSALELQERSIAQSQLADTTNFKHQRELEQLTAFIRDLNILEASRQCAKCDVDKELTVIFSMSALRACDVARALKPLKESQGVLKLINKNKIPYDQHALDSPSKVAAATAGRIRKLMELNMLNANRIGAIVVDSSFLNQKQDSTWDIEETIPVIVQILKENPDIKVFVF